MANALRRPPLPFPRDVDEIVDLCRRRSTSPHLTMTGLLVLELSQRCMRNQSLSFVPKSTLTRQQPKGLYDEQPQYWGAVSY